MRKVFDPNFAGLQIDWEHEQEVEFLGPAVLAGSSSQTAASCKLGKKSLYYLYPVSVRTAPTQLVLSYEDNPESWPTRFRWEVVKGELTIDFRDEFTRIPIGVSFWDSENDEREELVRDKDWVYLPRKQPSKMLVTPRGRITTTRLARPHQHLISVEPQPSVA